MEGWDGAEMRPVPCWTVESMLRSFHPSSSPRLVYFGFGGGSSLDHSQRA